MKSKITSNAYGKSSVLLTKVRRFEDRHELVEMKIKIRLSGDFERSYTHGDNANVIATDSMKNTVYLLAKDHPVDSPEAFALHLANHFVRKYEQVSWAEVHIHQSAWQRIEVKGTLHPTAFQSGGTELRKADIVCRPNVSRPDVLQGGLCDLLVLKTTDSEFTGFVKDEFTTLGDSTDRILATKISPAGLSRIAGRTLTQPSYESDRRCWKPSRATKAKQCSRLYTTWPTQPLKPSLASLGFISGCQTSIVYHSISNHLVVSLKMIFT